MYLSKQIHLGLYKQHLQANALVDINIDMNTNLAVAKLIHNKVTSASEFEIFCQSIPDFNIESTNAKQLGIDRAYFYHKCLYLAVSSKNAELVNYFISKFGKKILVQQNLNDTPIAIAATIYFSAKVLRALIDGGVNVNTPSIRKDLSTSNFSIHTPLTHAFQCKDEKAARMLMRAGAEEACMITADGIQLLCDAKSRPNHLRIESHGFYYKALIVAKQQGQPLVKRTHIYERPLKKELRAEIHAAAFQFFLGLSDSCSGIAVLPKELVAKISKESKPSNTIRKKAGTLLKEACYEICKNEMLFLCALQDSCSPIAMLNRDLILNIFKSRIQLEM